MGEIGRYLDFKLNVGTLIEVIMFFGLAFAGFVDVRGRLNDLILRFDKHLEEEKRAHSELLRNDVHQQEMKWIQEHMEYVRERLDRIERKVDFSNGHR